MPESFPNMRGSHYPTRLSARCPAYSACNICTGCSQYCCHNIICSMCEMRKPSGPCNHTDEQRYTIKLITELLKEPMTHVDKKPGEVKANIAEHEAYETISKTLESFGMGKVHESK